MHGAFLYMQYSVFGSIMTVGAILGAVMSGKIADLVGRRGVSLSFSHAFSSLES